MGQVRGLTAADLPADIMEMARHCALDWFGVTIAGAAEPLVVKLVEEAREEGGNPRCTLLWHGERTSSSQAALINGSAADALDFSDTNLNMHGHATPAVGAAALAAAEICNASGRDFLTALVAGIETECRVGLLAGPGYPRMGFHPTATLAPFGAAGAAAHLLGLDAERWNLALGLAATQAAGLHAQGGTMCKPFHSGKAAESGLLAATLANRGFTGRPNVIEAPQGFLDTHADARREDLLAGAEGRFLILDTMFKSHAACALTHGTIENMLALRQDHGVTPADIAHIELEVPPLFLEVCRVGEPTSGLEAKFSLPASAAMALIGDDTRDIGAYTAERVTRPELRALQARIHATSRDDLKGIISVAVAKLTDGRRLSVTNETSLRPMSDLRLQRDLLTRKFLSLVVPVLGESRARELLGLILDLDRQETLGPILRLAARQHG